MSLPIIAIVGATGTQGGSVVNALLSDEFKTRWAVRALTRNPDSDAAKALVARGATVAKIDLNDPSTIAPAFAGAAAVFAVTNSTDKVGLAAHGPYFEEVQGNAMADAAKAAGVRHFVWSTLADVERMSGGKYSVPFFTAKARVAAYTRAIGLPSTYVHAGFYMSNFFTMMAPKVNGDGEAVFASGYHPDTVIPLLDTARDFGRVVVGAALDAYGLQPVGAYVLAATSYRTWPQIAAGYAAASGKPASHVYTPFSDQAVAHAPPAFQPFMDMARTISEFGYASKDGGEWIDFVLEDGRSWEEYAKMMLAQ